MASVVVVTNLKFDEKTALLSFDDTECPSQQDFLRLVEAVGHLTSAVEQMAGEITNLRERLARTPQLV